MNWGRVVVVNLRRRWIRVEGEGEGEGVSWSLIFLYMPMMDSIRPIAMDFRIFVNSLFR